MRGLLYKDLYSLSKYIGILGALIVISAYKTTSFGGASYLYAVVGVFVPAIIFECMCTEPLNGWNRMVMTMPVTRHQVVSAKYILTLGLILSAYGLSIFLAETMSKRWILMMVFGKPFEERIIACMMMGMSLILNAILLPLMFEYETMNRIMMEFIVVAIPTILYLIYEFFGKEILFPWLSENYIIVITFFLAFALLCNVISYIISNIIYEQKEF